jgi:2-oxoglutarate dehydrogenase E2 component (dihydrolipoamide succinyltransferase)
MSTSVTMPRLGESVSEGTVTRWLKAEGDRVEVDEPLLEVSTDKVDTEIPSPAAGVLRRIVVGADETVEVGAELAVIGDEDTGDTADTGDSAGPADTGGAADTGTAGTDSAQPETAETDQTETAQPETAQPRAETAETGETGETADASGTAETGGTAGGGEPEQARGDASGQDGRVPAGRAAGRPSADAAVPAEAAPATAEPSTPDAPSGSGQPAGGTSVTMPALGESVTEGVVTRWLKQVGDTVEVDEPLVEVSTDKVDTEIPSPVAGTLLSITADEDATVPVGGELAVIGAAGAVGEGTASPASGSPAAGSEAEPTAARTEPQTAAETAPVEQTAAPEQTAPSQPAGEQADAGAQPAPEEAEARPAPSGVDAIEAPPASGSPSSRSTDEPAGEAADGDGQSPYVTPLVRRLASENRIDLAAIRGTGVGGRIRKQDIIEAAEARRAAEREAAARAAQEAEQARRAGEAERATDAGQAASAGRPGSSRDADGAQLRGRTEKLTRMRRVIAQRMVESLQTAAQLTTVVEVDLTRVARLRQHAKEDFEAKHGVKLSFLPFFAVAAVEALVEHPKVNAALDLEAGTITYPDGEHLGIAVDTERGLMVPVIRDAGDLNLGGMARKIADLAQRTRANKVSPNELSGGTFTLTNTGSRGALFDTPIINQPQSAILGTGAVVKRAVVVDDPDLGELILPRSMMFLALSYDHRLIDGADAARFLVSVKERLEAATFEADLGLV